VFATTALIYMLKTSGLLKSKKHLLLTHELYYLPVAGSELGHYITLSSKDEHKKISVQLI